MFFCEKPGPNWTIAKGMVERKEKPQKRPEKCEFFEGVWKSPLKQRVASDSNRDEMSLNVEWARDSSTRSVLR